MRLIGPVSPPWWFRLRSLSPALRRGASDTDPSAALGMPAHITALYPFLSQERLTASAIARLLKALREPPPCGWSFAGRAASDVLYLDPEPADGLRRLTTTIFEEWPEAPPFRGEFDDVIPHLTIVNGEDDEILDMVEQEISADLPFEANSRKPGCLSLTERDGSGAHVSASVARRGKHRFGREAGSLAPGTAIAIGTGP